MVAMLLNMNLKKLFCKWGTVKGIWVATISSDFVYCRKKIRKEEKKLKN